MATLVGANLSGFVPFGHQLQILHRKNYQWVVHALTLQMMINKEFKYNCDFNLHASVRLIGVQ